jgi:energy-coupling factor transport system ATP-binding protein
MEPEVLILDEPTAGLDPEGREEILSNIENYRKANNATIMMVSHSMNDMARLADRILVMRDARMVMLDTPENVFSRSQELLDMGLDIPQITRVFLHLRQMGVNVPQVYTMEQAVSALKSLKGGCADA